MVLLPVLRLDVDVGNPRAWEFRVQVRQESRKAKERIQNGFEARPDPGSSAAEL